MVRMKKKNHVMKKIVRHFLYGATGHLVPSLVVEELETERGGVKLMESQSALVNVLVQYKSLSHVAKISVQNGVTGVGGAPAQYLVEKELKLGQGLVVSVKSVQEIKKKRENVKRSLVLCGVPGVSGQAVQFPVELVLGTGSGNVDHQQGKIYS